MQLSAEQYEALTNSIQLDRPIRPGEKRRYPRIGVRGEATIIPLHEDAELHPVSVGVTDLSRQGICIAHTSSLDPGDQFILCLSYIGAETTRAIICTVRRREMADEDVFYLGCEFTSDFHPDMATSSVLTGLAEFQASAADSPLGHLDPEDE